MSWFINFYYKIIELLNFLKLTGSCANFLKFNVLTAYFEASRYGHWHKEYYMVCVMMKVR